MSLTTEFISSVRAVHHTGFWEINIAPTQASLNGGKKKRLTLVNSGRATELGLEVAPQPAKNSTLHISQAQAPELTSPPWARESAVLFPRAKVKKVY